MKKVFIFITAIIILGCSNQDKATHEKIANKIFTEVGNSEGKVIITNDLITGYGYDETFYQTVHSIKNIKDTIFYDVSPMPQIKIVYNEKHRNFILIQDGEQTTFEESDEIIRPLNH